MTRNSRCYNPPLPVKISWAMACGVLVLTLWLAPQNAAQSNAPTPDAAPDWPGAAKELADKIVGLSQSRSALNLTFTSMSAIPPDVALESRRALEAQLHAMGARMVSADQAVDEVHITLATNTREYVWVAQIGRGDARANAENVAMVTLPLPAHAGTVASSGLSLRRMQLWSQPQPILDVALVGDSMLVQGEDALTLYHAESGRWRLQSTIPVPHSAPWPRDLRGRLIAQGAGYTAFYPGMQCRGVIAPQFNASCAQSDDPWPLTGDPNGPRAFFNSTRNFFTAMSPALAGATPPFYSAARVGSDGATWVLAMNDGGARLVNASAQTGAELPGWGSDLAAVHSGCASGTQLLVTRPFAGATDSLRIFEITGGEIGAARAVEKGAELELPGPVTALWTAPDGSSATAVVRNHATGDYEAAGITVVCGR